MDDNGPPNTRTMPTNGLMRLLLSNMPFPAVGRLDPSVPFHRPPDAHAAIRDRTGVVQVGYARWHIGCPRA